jgi:hypothetical protein
MKGVHQKRQFKHLNDLDSAIDRLMTIYFQTTKRIANDRQYLTPELLDDLTIEVNNVRNVAQMLTGTITNSTEELLRMLVVKTTHCIVDALEHIFSSTAVEDQGGATVFHLRTDRTALSAEQDTAYFLMSLRSNNLLAAYNVKFTMMEGTAKVKAA